VDYSLYHALNMQAQRATLKCLDNKRKIASSIPNKAASGLGKIDAMGSTMRSELSSKNMDFGSVSKTYSKV
jgi:hypothetical protein